MDWSGCDLVEVIPGKISGAPLLKGTRLPVDVILANFEAGSSIQDIAENYPAASVETVKALLTYASERKAWDVKTLVDWSGCSLVEQVPGRCSGAPTVVGTRIFPDTIAQYYWSGATIEEIQCDFPSLSKETIAGLIGYVKEQKASAA
jgi:uncharacterized protein (DUF433 family)